jgi:hypothetical protein
MHTPEGMHMRLSLGMCVCVNSFKQISIVIVVLQSDMEREAQIL